MNKRFFTLAEGATHVATCGNVSGICTDYLKSFSGSINVDIEPLTLPSPTRGEGKEESVGDINQNTFFDKVFSRFTSHFSLKFTAFTLAEVLITLGIIGVVAAMTMPSLITNYQEKQRVSQLKKVYSALSQAFVSAVQENGTPDEWGMGGLSEENSHLIMANNFKKHLKLAQDCTTMTGSQASKVCGIRDNGGKYNSLNSIGTSRDMQGIILSDGTIVGFSHWSPSCSAGYSGSGETCGQIIVDLNGQKRPNSNGYDQFSFFLDKNKIVPFGVPTSTLKFERACNKSINSPYSGYSNNAMYACTAWVLYNENQDYLHCDDLSWDGKHSCKEKSNK